MLAYRRFGRPCEVLGLERADFVPLAPSAVRVRMRTAPINPSDLIPISGAYKHRIRLPMVAGYEGVGTVVAAGEGAVMLLGKRVLPLRGAGTWQRYVDCRAERAVPVPDDIDDSLAARAYINPLAAMLIVREHQMDGRTVLVTAAGSTCANLVAEWALRYGAREVIGIHRSSEHVEGLERINVTPVSIDGFGQIDRAASRADLTLDAVGGRLATRILASMRPSAVFLSYGLLSGLSFARPPVGPKLQRFHLRERLKVDTETWQGWFQDLWPLLRQTLLPNVANFPMADWREALALFEVPGRQVKPMIEL